MIFKATTLAAALLIASPSQVSAACLESFDISTDSCTYDALSSKVADLLDDLPAGTCSNDAESELEDIVGVTTPEEVQEYIASICNDAVGVLPFQDLSNEGEIFDKEYYDGGTYWNEEREYLLDSGVVEDRLKYDPGARINNIKRNLAEKDHITWPDYIDNFDDCDLRAVQCCFVQDRQANDNNGNCDDPYDERCTDANPGDNTDICYTDMSRAPTSSRTTEGFAIFEDEEEDDSHCHGLAWAADASDKSARFKGNNLFFVSMFDHFYTRGYVRNVPGAPMCGCVEKMPVVTRSDCTQIDVDENAQFTYNEDTGLQVEVTNFDIDFNACQGANNNNNDLEAYYEQLVDEGKAEEEELEELRKHLVGETYCREAIDEFLEDQNIQQEPACPLSDPQDCGCMIVEQQDYRGTQATTVDGHACQDWNLNLRNRYPDAYLESNYCRNPDGRERAWCYTDRATTGRSWQYCDVRECMAPLPTSTPSAAPSISAQPTGDLTETFNVALTGTASQSRTCYGGSPERAIDGNTNGSWRNRSVTHTCRNSSGSWWRLDLANKRSIIEKIVIYNRSDCCTSRIVNTYVQILDEDGQEVAKDTITSASATTTFEYDRLIRGAAIKIYNERNEFISLAEVEVMGKVPRTDAPTVAPTKSSAPTGDLVAESINLARTGTATQSCTGYGGSASRGIDGNNNASWGSRTITHTCRRMNASWEVKLASAENLIEKIVVWNRLDCCSERLSNSEVQILDKDLNVVERREIGNTRGVRSFEFEFPQRTFGKYVKVVLDGTNYLSLAEVEVIGKNLKEG